MRRSLLALAVAAAALGAARVARSAANDLAPSASLTAPYAPSPWAAPIVTLGYREVAADLLFVRLVGYFADRDSAPEASAALAEAIVALDPQFRRAWELGAIAMTDARRKPSQALQLRAVDFLERAARAFPQQYKFPMLAGQIYVGDLQTTDSALRARWNDLGARLLESASRMPGAPIELARNAAMLQSKLGQRQRAIDGLREILLITSDRRNQTALLEQLAELTDTDSAELAAEMFELRNRFEGEWRAERPAVNPSLYILIGPRTPAAFDLADLATGGRDLIRSDTFERLEPLTDAPDAPDAPPSLAPAPSP